MRNQLLDEVTVVNLGACSSFTSHTLYLTLVSFILSLPMNTLCRYLDLVNQSIQTSYTVTVLLLPSIETTQSTIK
jgi:hypothetical protein